MRKLYYDLKLRLSYLINGIKTRNELHLMDIVIYKNKEYRINNGTRYCSCGTHLWDLVERVPFDENGKRGTAIASEYKIKKVRCWENFKRGIFATYDFQMNYWHSINLRELINQ